MCWQLGPRLADPIIERWLDCEGPDLINGLILDGFLIQWYYGKWWNFWRHSLVKRKRSWGACLEGYASLSASWLRWGECLGSTMPSLSWCSLKTHGHRTERPLAKRVLWNQEPWGMVPFKLFLSSVYHSDEDCDRQRLMSHIAIVPPT